MMDKPNKKGSRNRRKSRELALKAVYRVIIHNSTLQQLFLDSRDDPDYDKADEDYFRQLLTGVINQQAQLDQQIAAFTDRQLTDLSPIEHAILRIAAHELMFDYSIPYRVTINEGVELAKIYGGAEGHRYINGVLDKIAATSRPHEFRK